ncbi:TonB-linked SusC/RagA family outer membrane protein [Winogradskyella wandonensis]|uniref:TonB-linked SusC/RagA family outer membrane protein n=1 Tax=Winogradskyella wandonensis TaxID=1442586 RepID=A0A4R1KTP7_9FLAO|nr:SusC/RagA family TonB-linked outer membrane protein [Winogradskyella wandonensis]TCK68565.1 TonB-linked SusC/RagA family outer membrane protein [Winogradskyella wandonensis]
MKTKLNGILLIFTLLVFQFSNAQERIITGIVNDVNNLPLPGVNVLIKGTTTGTQTDFDGKYSLSAKSGDVLVFSYVGLKTQEIIVAESNTINISMEEDSESLDEIIITAVGIKRKPDEITTANQVVKSEELNQANNPDAVQALAGKVSGLQINTTSAGLAPNTQITLRGNRSISGNNNALIVIDNVVSTAQTLSSLDPNTIESLNVLKGPNGAALYGEQGAAGVIIVTTKKGSKNASKFNINIISSATFEEIAFLPETQNRFGQGWGGNIETVDQGSWGVPYNGIDIPIGTPDANGNFRYFPYMHIEDNILPFFNTGVNLQNAISISAGDVDNGYLNFSYLNQDLDGIIPDSKLTKNNFSLTTGKKLGKFSVQGIARYTSQKTEDVNANMYRQLMNTPGNVPIEAFSSGDNNDHWTIYETSPYWTLRNNRGFGNRNIFDLSAELSYEFNDHISSVLRSSVRTTTNETEIRRNAFEDNLNFVFGDRSIRSFYQVDNDREQFIYTDFLVNFDYNLTEDITFKSNIGFNATDRKYNREFIGGFDLAVPGLFQLSNITSIPEFDESNIRQRTSAIFGQVDLGYKDYLFLNITGRNDWNSVLPKQNRSFFYPSLGVSFIPTRAFENLKSDILYKAKLSASYVKTGNATALGPQQLSTVGVNDTFFPGTGLVPIVAQTTLVDQNIKPEFINSFEANANLEFLNRQGPRLTLDISASLSKNTDQILAISSSSPTGFFNTLINVGETRSKSLEIDLGFTPLKTEDFEFNGRIGFSTFRTTVEKVTDQSDRVQVANLGTAGAFAIEGQEFPQILGTAYQRDEQGRVVIDANGNPLIDSELKILGQATPDYILNFGFNFRYKGFRLAAVGDYRTGHQFFSGIKRQLSGQGRTFDTTFNDRQPFVFPNSTVEGSGVTNTTVLTAGGGNLQPLGEAYAYYTGDHNNIDENFIVDATAFKLREVSLTYDFSTKIVESLNLSRLSVGVSGRNLLTILPKSNLDYNDPEFAGRFGLATYGITPPTRYYTFNVNLSF